MRRIGWVILLSILSIVSVISAQDCTALFLEAIESVDSLCNATSRNESCYGSDSIQALLIDRTQGFLFEAPGDIAGIENIQSLTFSPYSFEDEQWGVAVMKVQADLPDTLPGQNVTIILFGDVTIANEVEPLPDVNLLASAGVNVRSRPTTTTDNIVASLRNGQEVSATGILEDGSWTRISFLYDDETQINGWVSTGFLSGDRSQLKIVSTEDALYLPMQAFYLTTGIGRSNCNEIPNSGILIQTPDVSRRVQFNINGVDISLGSTIYVQAVPGDVMRVYTIEGFVTIRANGTAQNVPAGSVTIISLDDNGIATGSPQFPIPYNFDTVSLVNPILGVMPDVVEVPPALEPDAIEAEIETSTNNTTDSGGSTASFIIGTRVVVGTIISCESSGGTNCGMSFKTTPCSSNVDAGRAVSGIGGVVIEEPVDCGDFVLARFQMDNGVIGWSNIAFFIISD